MSKASLLLAFAVIFGITAPSVLALPTNGTQGKGSGDRALDVSGSLDIPGVGTVNLGDRRKEPPGVDPRDGRRIEPPPVDGWSDRKHYTEKALDAIHLLAEQGGVQKTDAFSGYEKARQSLSTIRVVADIFANDRVFRSISQTAAETLSATREDWGPFDAEKVNGVLKTIANLSK